VPRRNRQAGFTLLEVMVALVVVALALTAVAASMSQMLDAAGTMRERTFASWIALNKIAEMRLANVVPKVSETSGEVDYAGTTWGWRLRDGRREPVPPRRHGNARRR
jgi:general secretion pathway protein I